MYERFTKLFSKKHEDQIEIGSPGDLRKGDMNPNTQHDMLPKFQPEGLISREAAQAMRSKEDQTEVRPQGQRPVPTAAPNVRGFGPTPITLQAAQDEFATVAQAQEILKPKPQWVSAKSNVQSTANEILEQNYRKSTPQPPSNSNPDRELGRTRSSKQL
jgi:hypothetical protein